MELMNDTEEISPRKRIINVNIKNEVEDEDLSSIDKIKTIDINERRHQEVAKDSLKKHSVLTG